MKKKAKMKEGIHTINLKQVLPREQGIMIVIEKMRKSCEEKNEIIIANEISSLCQEQYLKLKNNHPEGVNEEVNMGYQDKLW